MKYSPILLSCILISACGSEDADDDKPEVVISAALPLTGPSAAPEWLKAAKLALEDVNDGMKKADQSYRFALNSLDTKADSATAPGKALELVKDGAKVVITDTSGDTIATNMTFYDGDAKNDLKVPLLSIGATSPSINVPDIVNSDPVKQAALRNEDGWLFRTNMHAYFQARVLINLIFAKGDAGDINDDGEVKLSLYIFNDSYGLGFREALEEAALATNPDTDIEVIIHEEDDDHGANIARLTDNANDSNPDASQDTAPDAVIEVSLTSITLAISEVWTSGGNSAPLYHIHGFRTPSVLAQLGSSIEGHEGTSPVVADESPSGKLFAREMRDRVNLEPSMFTPNAYDAVFLAALAIVKANQDRADPTTVKGAQVRDQLESVNDPSATTVSAGADGFAEAVALIEDGDAVNYDGASGTLDWDANYHVLNRVSHYKVEDQAYVDVAFYDCTADASCPSER